MATVDSRKGMKEGRKEGIGSEEKK